MPRPPQFTEKELLNEIRRLADEIGKEPPSKQDMDRRGNHGAATYTYRFGSWNTAVRKAGFEPNERITEEEFKENPDRCPLCGEDVDLDYHHWKYAGDRSGCYLCRECHDDVHQGKAKTANVDWLKYAVKNLVLKHVEHHGESDSQEIVERYDMPNVIPLVEMALTEPEQFE